MRKIILYASLLLIFFATGCSNNKDPKKVLITFLEALSKNDIATAKKNATQDSQGLLNLVKNTPPENPGSTPPVFNASEMEFGDPKIEGDKATITVRNKNSGPTTTYTLKKESGGWKVAFNKETLPEMLKGKQ